MVQRSHLAAAAINRRTLLGVGLLSLCAVTPRPVGAVTSEQVLLTEAQLVFQDIVAHPELTDGRGVLMRAHALVIFPEVIRGGFLVGGEGGVGALLRRRPDGGWSYPAFVRLIGGSVGLQVGAQVSEMVLAIMSPRGLDALLDRGLTIGADLSAAVISLGVGADARTGLDRDAEMYAFTQNKGLFLGGSLEGNVIQPYVDANQRFYGLGVTTRGILEGRFVNAAADPLRRSLPE